MAAENAQVGIDAAAADYQAEKMAEAWRRYKARPWWMASRFNGRLYRPLMKVMHRFGWCYPQPTFPEEDVMWWCTWCGLRGRK